MGSIPDGHFIQPMNNTTNTTHAGMITYKAIQVSIQQIRDMEDPLFEWMKEKGYDPDTGGKLVINHDMTSQFGDRDLPDYVIVSNFIVESNKGNPFLINTYELLLDVKNRQMSCQDIAI